MPAVITVLNADDSGAGSLRAAIERANLDPAEDTIEFAPAVGGTITLLTALPELSTDMTISRPRGVGPGGGPVRPPPGTPDVPDLHRERRGPR